MTCGTPFQFKHSTLEKTCNWQCEQIRMDDKEKGKQPRKKKKAIAQVSDKRLKQLSEYRDKRKVFLIGKRCPVTGGQATEIHHMDGREGDRLLNFDKCLGVSRSGHTWIHEHPAESRAKGWLI